MSGFKSAVLFVKHNIRVISIFFETMVFYFVGLENRVTICKSIPIFNRNLVT